VILTEGDTELGALPVWFKELGFPLEAHDIAVFSVDGDTKFPIPLLFLREFAAPGSSCAMVRSLVIRSSRVF
jgi:hypothetical protein